MKRVFVIVLFLILSVNTVYAHGLGASFEKTVSKYFIDIGYDPSVMTEGEQTTFSFTILTDNTKDLVEFDSVWVRIMEGRRAILATGIDAGINSAPTMIYTFPKDGEYRLFVRFEKGDDTLAEAEFPMTVVRQEEGSSEYLIPLASLAGGILIGVGSVFTFLHFKSKKGNTHEKSDTSKKS